MIIEKYIKVTEQKYRIVGYECDSCGLETRETFNLPKSWFYLRAGHRSWGNDSCDSVDSFHLCSVECLLKALKQEHKRLSEEATSYYEFEELSNESAMQLIKALENKN